MDYYTTSSYYNSLDYSQQFNTTFIEYPEETYTPARFQLVIEIILSVLIVLSNGIIICGILLNWDLRTNSKHLLILILCIVDFWVGAVRQPAAAYIYNDTYTTNPTDASPDCHKFLYYILELSSVSASTIGITMVSLIAIDWIVMVTVKNYTNSDRKKLAIFMTAFVFIGAIFLALSLLPYMVFITTPFCFVSFNLFIPLTCTHESGPLLFLVITTLMLIICHVKQRNAPNPVDMPLDIIVAAILTLVLNAPWNLYKGLNFLLPRYVGYLNHMVYFIMLRLGALKCAIVPLAWLLDKHTRVQVKRGLTCKAQCCKSSTQSIEMTESP